MLIYQKEGGLASKYPIFIYVYVIKLFSIKILGDEDLLLDSDANEIAF